MTQLRHITGSLAVIGAALMLMAAALLGARDAALAAGTQPELLIAPLGSSSWAKAADGAWEFEGLLPGAPVTGGVQLRLLNPAGNDAMVLSVTSPSTPGRLVTSATVASMTLDGVDLLTLWSSCTSAGDLTVQALMTCPTRPELPAPSASGSTFMMSFALPGSSPNSSQGISTGSLTFRFTLLAESSTSEEPPAAEEPPTAGAPSGNTGSNAGGTIGGGASTPDSNAGTGSAAPSGGPGAPPPASTGHGLDDLTSSASRVPMPVLLAVTGALLLLVAWRRKSVQQ